jgi:3-oxosteroid 1-dehydrogenase
MAPDLEWDHEVDALIVGSGAAGLTAALAANANGLNTLVIEKTKYFGGTTAFSGGGLWIPNNPVLKRAGMKDSVEDARTYLDAVLALNGDDVSAERREAFLTEGPRAIEFLEQQSEHLKFIWVKDYPDYHPELPGGSTEGRQIQIDAVDGRILGAERGRMRRARLIIPQPFGMWIMIGEARELSLVGTSWKARILAVRLGMRGLAAQLRGKKIEPFGGLMLIAALRAALMDKGVPLWLSTPFTELVTVDGAVVGAVVEHEGKALRIGVRGGVVLAAGGFERNEHMRHEYQLAPTTNMWTLGSPGNTGDAIRGGMAVGARLGLMEDSWWAPGILTPEGHSVFLLTERQAPPSFIVNTNGDRYTNESAPYVNVGHAMYEAGSAGETNVPSWFVVDQTFRNRYKLGPFLPRQRIPKTWFDSGVVVRSETIAGLAKKMQVPPDRLQATFERFNGFAQTGRDLDFHRGESAYDRYYSDPKQKPNPCIGPVAKPPFLAFKLVPGDIGTKGGLLTDEHAQVLGEDGAPITGLYAAGNSSASVMGHEYAGPGATIGPAVTFGFVASNHIAAALGTSGPGGSGAPA